MTSSEAPASKVLKSRHVHQPRGAFLFNASGSCVNTEAEYEQLYRTEMQLLGSPKYLDTSNQSLDIPQMAGMQYLPGTTPTEDTSSSLGTKRDFNEFLNDSKLLVDDSITGDSEAINRNIVKLPEDPKCQENCPWESPFDDTWLNTGSDQFLSLRRAENPDHVNRILSNPFVDNSTNRYSEVKKSEVIWLKHGAVDGYLKFRWGVPESSNGTDGKSNYGETTLGVHHHEIPSLGQKIPKLPRSFAAADLDQLDRQFLRFYLSAFCKGRTLLTKTNLWYFDIAPMVSTNDCVKHALLALSAGYWLHFRPNETIMARANSHYRTANKLLTEEMQKSGAEQVGKEDGLVAAMLLLFIDDAVNYELRREKYLEPRWRSGARTASWILSQSDPGQRYWKPSNVQCTTARTSNSNFVAFVEILAQVVTPLRIEDTDQKYLWLLHGSEAESRHIHGSTGLCPKLLHILAQVTSICAHMTTKPESAILPHGACALLDLLTNFRQTSDLSQGYPTTEALLRSCKLDGNGKVTDDVKVTELTAESWVATAKIYLLCRFFRKPRSHPDVQAHLKTLLKCIGWMPCTGKLFTSQSPFLCVFVMCMVSETEEARAVGREWFENVTSDTSNRSSVPPVWGAVTRTWKWFDEEFKEKDYDDTTPISDRYAWWEELVTMLVETEGEIALY